MKYIISIILVFPFFLTGMDKAFEGKNTSICFEMKHLNTEGPRSDFVSFAKKMRQAGLNTCECIKILMEHKKQEARNALSREFDFKEGFWKSLDSDLKLIHEDDKKLAEKNGKRLLKDETIPQHVVDSVVKAMQEYDISAPIGIQSTPNKETGMRRGSPQEFHMFSLNLNDVETLGALDAVMRHELTHARFNHYLEKVGLLNAIWKKRPEEVTVQESNRAFLKYSRYNESVADRIPCACDGLKAAKNIAVLMANYKESSQKIGTSDIKFLHPSDNKRAEWAERIYRLVAAESKINNF